MKTIGHHFNALQWTFLQFTKGKYLVYFIPGILFALLFWWLQDWSQGLISTDNVAANDHWYSNFWAKAISQTGHFLFFFFHQLAIFFILTLFSPINTFLSESVDKQLTGETVGFDLIRFVNELIRMVFIVTLAIAMEWLLMGVWSFFAWLFGLQFLTPFVFFMTAAFFYGFSFYDYSLERHEISVLGSFRFAKKYAIPTLVTGIFFSIILLIPVIGLAIAPVIITIASTHVFLKMMGKLDIQTQTNE
ncbi:MAG: EI24 domain-containing protein [Crocinitomicaceae bacterium]